MGDAADDAYDMAIAELMDDRYIDEDQINDVCPLCGAKAVLKEGRFGVFYGCSKYPKCTGSNPA